ncbi:MAG: energy-coupling factor transporter transmembrane protein EcfT [Atopobiaceae bacterium]|nr:energy-coupling factor transporter transmembrane protein EcfT [Atopobiaceae bacterium]
MAFRISLGRYVPADSPIHRLDPRAKIVCGVALMVSVFFIQTPVQLAFGWACALALVLASRVPAGKVLESIRPVIAVLMVLSLFNLLLVTSGDTLVSFGPLRITTDGLWAAVNYSLRLVVAVIAANLILLTTTPTQLTDAFDALLAPLSRIGLPGHEIAMVFSLMLRFIPTIADEASAIVDAQTARGGALAEGSPIRRVRAVVPVIVALLASSLRHANGLSRALDARCYEGGAARGHWHPLQMHPSDWLALAVTAAYVVVLISLG